MCVLFPFLRQLTFTSLTLVMYTDYIIGNEEYTYIYRKKDEEEKIYIFSI